MGIILIDEPSVSDPQSSDWELFINNIIKKTKGLNATSITNGFNALEPIIQLGSVFEVNSNYYYCDSDENISGWDGVVDGTVYIYTNGVLFYYSSVIPTWDVELFGWYNTGNRALYKLVKDGTWNYKTILIGSPEHISVNVGEVTVQRNMNIKNETYLENLNADNVNVTEYLESNGGTMNITTINANAVTSTGTTTVSGTMTATGGIQSGPNFISNVWSSGADGGNYFTGSWPIDYGYYNMRVGGMIFQIWTGSSWVGNIHISNVCVAGNPDHYRIYNSSDAADIYWRLYS